ncbi:hypothetical protein H4219_006010 [Mycoemilia scoparia]|uniref:Pro-apoptotic serine protease NMA111 n=1 Tax=Mycoemilia scoparia TaxID=417184 RepID=A0A9W7ZKC6_9FUNG|nr:hypothetical protein H4219_006010 [Mycoemilia scoparia]
MAYTDKEASSNSQKKSEPEDSGLRLAVDSSRNSSPPAESENMAANNKPQDISGTTREAPNRSTVGGGSELSINPSQKQNPQSDEQQPMPGTVSDNPPLRNRKSSTFADLGMKLRRRRSLAQSDLMAVFYPPHNMSQHIITDTPFEARQLEGVKDEDLNKLELDGVPSWEPTLERSIKAIVSISANCVRSFDTENGGFYTATGFVIDAEIGLILSNRHVVNPGPIVAQATFTNYEEVDLIPVYRDPIHDFGVFKFDPSKIKFLDLQEIKLAPHKAKVGMEIRVVGNDAGEKLSILSGTLARLDRNAPNYGTGRYNDFNTFYLQAASSTSGGSSGSPVLDIYGDAIALNAGGHQKAASSFYLPLDRVVRALNYIREGLEVPRGTLQTEFVCKSYDALRRLGLSPEIEEGMRYKFPEKTGMLTVQNVLPKGPADGHLQAGDILVAVEGVPIVDFVSLHEIVDESVGKSLKLTIWRNLKAYDVTVDIQDLHSITPSSFVEVGGGVFNELSYQLAHTYCVPVQGVYVASAGYMFSMIGAYRRSVILSINHQKTPDLESFYKAISNLTDGSRVPVRFYTLGSKYLERVSIMNVTCHWHSFRIAHCNNKTGLWDYTDIPLPMPSISEPQPQTAYIQKLSDNLKPANSIWPSIVTIDYYVPYLVSGTKFLQFYGPGLIVDKEKGLIVCDRDTVFTSLGDVYITFAQSIVIPARILYMHPIYCLVVLKYDPKLLGNTPVKNAKFHPDYMSGKKRLNHGDQTYLVGVGNDHQPVMRSTHVASRSLIRTKEAIPPRWRTVNCEGVALDDQPPTQGGILCDSDGLITGFWVNISTQNSKGKEVSFASGIDANLIVPVIESLKRDENPVLRHMDIDMWTIRLASARPLGLSSERIKQVEELDDNIPQLFYVRSILDPESEAGKLFKSGDILLDIDGQFIKKITDVAILPDDKKEVEITLLREGEEITMKVPTTPLYGMEGTRIVCWAGATFQSAFLAVREQLRTIPSDIYVSSTSYGSPSSRYDIKPNSFVIEVDGTPVKTLDDFYKIIKAKEDNAISADKEGDGDALTQSMHARVTLVNMQEKTSVVSVKLDEHYWPLSQMIRDDSTVCGWRTLL